MSQQLHIKVIVQLYYLLIAIILLKKLNLEIAADLRFHKNIIKYIIEFVILHIRKS